MRPPDLLATTTFRLALIYFFLFAGSVIPVLGFIYWSTAGFMARQIDETLDAEVRGLEEQYRERQIAGLAEIIRQRSADPGESVYLLTRADGTKLAGTLHHWPAVPDEPVGFITFPYTKRGAAGGEERYARGRFFLLSGGVKLLVARDVSQGAQVQAVITNSLIYALLMTAVLGLLGAALMSRNMMRRLETINKTSREIMGGDLSRRVPLEGTGDELDQLATNLNAMLDQIERLMGGMRTVTDNIAHDLRSPLTRLRNRLEVTLMDRLGAEDYRQAIEQTIDESDGLLKTFNALLSIASAEAGAVRERMGDLRLAELAADVVELYEPVAEERGIALAFRVEDDGRVRAHREIMGQALANLMDNAIKYSPAGGAIKVCVEPVPGEAGTLQFVVEDEGPGIPADARDRVRDRFVRLEASRNTPGSGLGLSLVSAVARLHEGALELEDARSEPPFGLKARLLVPRAHAQA